MKRPYFSPQSRRDLQEILDYIAKDDPRSAVKFVEKLEEKCSMLAKAPEMGTLREDLVAQLRVWPVSKYLIFYRSSHDGIEIVRVVHGARDIGKLF